MSKTAIRINSADIVAVALQPLAKGTAVTLEASGNAPETTVTVTEDITAGHKFAIRDIKKGEPIIKYGYPIGAAQKTFLQEAMFTHTTSTPCFLKNLNTLTTKQTQKLLTKNGTKKQKNCAKMFLL